ncbi:hypothetical protein EMIHUDRAFT_219274 [Emiliania huxleyi CCMP1516]|uniref:Ankyrin repeat protein n=2 Tax=Emiliania huxleyi TaxID=2903 RepID=A0A0D3I557_EMIH1|nr:hypothetical protein EMIHUDRAFT_219274 [Emiliania huxleyi CCMP1516]EOD06392.1 hypothetical protein EMIHUDRAFT_219274 [Emiliania huxleyi CCMP1516]|eukprot:XP_005758821.1 hypothetical protein EMIHUDRAFT_219274 [Emiliania huxleyi CCMP1516]
MGPIFPHAADVCVCGAAEIYHTLGFFEVALSNAPYSDSDKARGCANLGRNASGSPISVLRGWVGGFPGARGGQQPACIPTGDAAAGLAFKVREGVSPLLVYAANSVDWYPSQGLSNDTGAQIASLLLAHGADPNEIGPANNTAIAEASARGDVGFVELLLRHGADPRGQRGGSTPGQCKMGAACFFYHGEDDVSTPERPIPVPKWLADQAKQEGIDVIEDGSAAFALLVAGVVCAVL